MVILVTFQNCGSSSGTVGSGVSSYTNFSNDSSGPDINLLDKPMEISSSASASFQISAIDDGSGVTSREYNLDDAGWLSMGSVVNFSDLTLGPHSIMFRAQDKNKNFSDVITFNWMVDTELPTIDFGTKTPHVYKITNSDGTANVLIMPKLSDRLTLYTYTECALYSGNGLTRLSICDVKPNRLDVKLAAGNYLLKVAGTDQAGNSAEATFLFAVVLHATDLPTPVFITKPLLNTNSLKTTIRVESIPVDGANLVCRFTKPKVAEVIVPCQSGVDWIQTLANSPLDSVTKTLIPYTFTASLEKTGSVTTTATTSWVIDTINPEITVLKPTAAELQEDPRIKNFIDIQFRAKDNSNDLLDYHCFFDGVERTCSSGLTTRLDDLVGGAHKFEITVTDPSGNSATKVFTWNNASCNPNDLAFRWPLNGMEGTDWSVISYVDTNLVAGRKRDFSGAVDDLARVSDNTSYIVLTTGDSSTTKMSNNFAKVFAVDDGVVKAVENSVTLNTVYYPSKEEMDKCTNDPNLKKYNYIEIEHANGYRTRYENLQVNSKQFAVDAVVKKGDYLGQIGSSGCTSFPRLSFRTYNCNRTLIDPVEQSLFTIAPKYDTPVKLINVTLHKGDVKADPKDWVKVMTAPEPQTSYAIDSSMMVTFFVNGAKSTDRLRFEVIDGYGDHICVTDSDNRFTSAGFFQRFTCQLTTKKPTTTTTLTYQPSWIFRAIHIKEPSDIYREEINPVAASITFTVKKP